MKYRNIPFLMIALVLVVFGLFAYWWWTSKGQVHWRENYSEKSKNPYDTYIVRQFLNDCFAGKKVFDVNQILQKALPKLTDSTANYVMIGEAILMDTIDMQALCDFVERGNTAFLSTKTIPNRLLKKINLEKCDTTEKYRLLKRVNMEKCDTTEKSKWEWWWDYSYAYDSCATFNLDHPKLHDEKGFPIAYIRKADTIAAPWHYIGGYFSAQNEECLLPLGNVSFYMNQTMEDTIRTDSFYTIRTKVSWVNFAQKKYGKGTFYFHTSPIAFSNIQLLQSSGRQYAERVLAHLQKGDIYWEVFNRTDEQVGRSQNMLEQTLPSRSFSENTPLQYILSQPPLRWGWYLLLFLVLMYLIFKAKREQRVIPVLEENSNTSLDFIATIGRLYYIKKDHQGLALLKIKLFLASIRTRYGILTTNLDQDFVVRLGAKTGVSDIILKPLIDDIKEIQQMGLVTEDRLIRLHQQIESFYHLAK